MFNGDFLKDEKHEDATGKGNSGQQITFDTEFTVHWLEMKAVQRLRRLSIRVRAEQNEGN